MRFWKKLGATAGIEPASYRSLQISIGGDRNFRAGLDHCARGLQNERAQRQDSLRQYVFREVPVGIAATGARRECDATGWIDVPADRYWGARTQRALEAVSDPADCMPERFFRCCGFMKRATAAMNAQAGRLPPWKAAAITRAADDLIAGRLAGQFPLPVRHAGSESRGDINVNEVLANRAAQLLGQEAGRREPIDPDRDVAMGQSLASTFTASMYLATVIEIEDALVPRCLGLIRAMERQANPSPDHGRRLQAALARLDEAEGSLHALGSDPADMDWRMIVALVAAHTGRPFIVAAEGFSGGASVDAMVAAMAAIRGLAIVLGDVAASLRDGRGTAAPCEAMTSSCRYVIGQDQIVAEAASGYRASACLARPLIVASVLKSLCSLGESCEAMRRAAARSRKTPPQDQADGFTL